MYHFILSALCVALLQSAIAQNSISSIGARANGLGYAVSCISDGWSALNNPAGLAAVRQFQAGASFESVPGFSAFNRMAAFVAMPLKTGTIATGVYRFGDELYNEHLLRLGYANRFGLASLGGGIQYIQYRTEGFGGKSLLSFSAGGIAELTPWISAGAQIINVIQPDITEDEKIPTILIAGVALKASGKVTVMVDVEKDIAYKPTVRSGLEYEIHKKFSVRTGFSLNPEAGFFGFGFTPKQFSIDYAFSHYPGWASRHQASVVYLLPEKK